MRLNGKGCSLLSGIKILLNCKIILKRKILIFIIQYQTKLVLSEAPRIYTNTFTKFLGKEVVAKGRLLKHRHLHVSLMIQVPFVYSGGKKKKKLF